MSGNKVSASIMKSLGLAARQAFVDLFRWKIREVTDENGETHYEWKDPEPLKNPISLFAQLSGKDWFYFLVGLFAWTADAFDFHALSIQTVKLSNYYGQSLTAITTAITLTLLLRSIGAACFGLAGDKFGRKWPMVFNMIILGILQIATIYSKTFSQFLAVRSLFGLFMGGVYGNAIAMALENCPVNARGLISGILQQGYAMGYVAAACANLGVGGSTESWKTVFWIAAGLSFLAGLIRLFLPESKQFIEARKAGKKAASPGAFWRDTKAMLRKEWGMVVYCIFLLTWMNYYSHMSQDSYTTLMLTQKALDNSAASRASIVITVGACVGGTVIGYLSQWIGRRRSIIFSCMMSAFVTPAWVLPHGEQRLSATGFIMQFFVQGAWGIIPIHLNELSPPAFRSSFPGITYQIGNMLAAPAAQMVNGIAEAIIVTGDDGLPSPAYAPVMGVGTAIIAIGISVTTMFGPEKRGRQFELAGAAGTNAASEVKDVEAGLSDESDEVEIVGRNKEVEV